MWPATFSLAVEKIPTGGTVLFALLALFGDLGCSSGPAFVGKISEAFGEDVSKGLLFASIFPLLLVVGLYLQRRITNKENVKSD